MSLFLLLYACTTAEPPEPAPEPAPVEAPAPEPEPEAKKPDWTVKKHMDARFVFATDALWKGFAGDLEGLKKEAAALPDREPLDETPESWEPYLDQLHKRSKALSEVTDLDQAAKGMVALAETCASCHTANNGPEVTEADLKVAPKALQGAMDRHQWAIYMMWIGLVAPDDRMWKKGAETFAHDRKALPDLPENVQKLELHVHDLAANAVSAKPEQRGPIFAEIITTCAQCHGEVGVKLP